MKNLAGIVDCDIDITKELTEAGIELIILRDRSESEVANIVEGRLGMFHFSRAWYYWVVEGPVPLALAQSMHNSPLSKEVRVAGHGCAPAPKRPWVKYYTQDTWKNRCDESQKDGIQRIVKEGFIDKQVLNKYDFVLSQEVSDGVGFVHMYHIDTQRGLNFFVETIKAWATSS